jgi:Bacterial Ig-like domain (group 2)
VRASLGAVASDEQTVTVVERATILSLSVYPHGGPIGVFDGGPVRPGADAPCFECGYSFTMLSGDTVQFGATAHYDTGEWEDVTGRVTWRSNDAAVATVADGGLVTAGAAGAAEISATLEAASSAPTAVRVVAEATLQGLSAYMEGADRAIGVGDEAVFHAAAYYDVGFGRDVTAEVTWRSSDESVGGFDTAGVFTGRAAGDVLVWAELDGVESTRLPLEVFATSELAYCDPAAVNRGTWSDDFNRVTLESDCARYTQPDVVELRFSVTEQQRPGGIFDPCLDLEAWRGDTLVRTIREEGCGDVFLPPGALGRDEAAVRYQLKAFWDLKDDAGQPVAPGEYEIRGTFYLYYDPVVTIDITVEAPTGE